MKIIFQSMEFYLPKYIEIMINNYSFLAFIHRLHTKKIAILGLISIMVQKLKRNDLLDT